ncbi:MAG TPA: glycosyltransferase family 9 protein [Verrucomicrobiae bacterium]|nr:glycosyltransferase family 9 protein [Verrucomicrobiae bacterium]
MIPPAADRIDRLLIVRLSAMGDVIHTLPAVQALRNTSPDCMIGWLIEERWSELLCAPGFPLRGSRAPERPLADWVHTVRLRSWGKSLATLTTIQEIAKAWNDVRSVHYQVAIDLQGAIRSALLAQCSGAPVVYGSAEPRESPASIFYTREALPRGLHVIEQNLSIAEAVAKMRLPLPLVNFPRSRAAENRIAQWLAQRFANAGDRFAILNPGAGWGAKRWPADRYAQVAQALASDGVRSILNYGPGEEELAQAVASTSEGMAIPFESTLSELIALTRRASLFVGGDTGPMHLAAALQVPVVAIFGPTNPARNGPFGTRSVVLRSPESVTTHARRSQPDRGLLEITTASVIDAARRLLASAPAKVHHG